jgi:ABC-2 type transport system ATP-binding protein
LNLDNRRGNRREAKGGTRMGDTVLDVRAVSKSYDGRPAVKDLSFSVEAGSICGFLGPNGAGKTTTLRMILDIISPDAGSIALFGKPSAPEARDRIGFLPEERGLYRKMTAEGVIVFFGRMKGMKASVARERARRLLIDYGLRDAVTKKVKQLSKGMAQKVQILASIVHEPELVILDEPFSGLDPVNQKTLEEMVRGLKTRGATVLFSTHVMEHAERLCDRIVLLARGSKVFDGRVADALGRVPRRVFLETDIGVDLGARVAARGVTLAREDAVEGRQVWRADLADGADAQELLRACVDAGVALRRFEPVRAHLHDAFVHLVGSSESGPASGRAEEAA